MKSSDPIEVSNSTYSSRGRRLESTGGDSEISQSVHSTASSGNTQWSSPQHTRHARRLYFGSIPPKHADEEMFKTFLNSVISSGLQEDNNHSYVVSVYINQKKFFAFVELKSIELATACLDLDGIEYYGSFLKVHRANEYKPQLIQNSGTTVGPPIKLNFSHSTFVRVAGKNAPPAPPHQRAVPTVQYTSYGNRTLGHFVHQGDLTHVDEGTIAIVGFPFDEGSRRTGSRLGAGNGPKVARRILKKISVLKNAEFGTDIRELNIVDLGDIIPGLSLEEAHMRLCQVVTEVIGRGAYPLILGGSKDLICPAMNGLTALNPFSTVSMLSVDSTLAASPFNFTSARTESPLQNDASKVTGICSSNALRYVMESKGFKAHKATEILTMHGTNESAKATTNTHCTTGSALGGLGSNSNFDRSLSRAGPVEQRFGNSSLATDHLDLLGHHLDRSGHSIDDRSVGVSVGVGVIGDSRSGDVLDASAHGGFSLGPSIASSNSRDRLDISRSGKTDQGYRQQWDCSGRLHCFAAQGMRSGEDIASYIRDHGGDITWLTRDLRATNPLMSHADRADGMGRKGTGEIVSEALAALGLKASSGLVYCNFSVEAIAASVFPGSSNVGTIGLTASETIEICMAIGASQHTALFSITDFAPDVEEQRSSKMISDMLQGLLMGLCTIPRMSKTTLLRQRTHSSGQSLSTYGNSSTHGLGLSSHGNSSAHGSGISSHELSGSSSHDHGPGLMLSSSPVQSAPQVLHQAISGNDSGGPHDLEESEGSQVLHDPQKEKGKEKEENFGHQQQQHVEYGSVSHYTGLVSEAVPEYAHNATFTPSARRGMGFDDDDDDGHLLGPPGLANR